MWETIPCAIMKNVNVGVIIMGRWDKEETAVRRFNPLPVKIIVIGMAVYLGITLGYYLFWWK